MNGSKTHREDWVRRYPPLLAMALAVLVAVFVLPSSLDLQQANPTETQQFAPVPPSSRQAPSQLGNLSSLSLGTSASLGLDAAGGPGAGPATSGGVGVPGQPGTPLGAGALPSEKDCVGDPPRQTQDPLSPPCVAYYAGNNGGATYAGVTRTEVRVLIYADAEEDYNTSEGTDSSYSGLEGKCFDLSQPVTINSVELRNYRRWQLYFNDRYQTYHRLVHFWACFSSDGDTAAGRVADAASFYAEIHPFATITSAAVEGILAPYDDYMAAHHVLIFGSLEMNDNSFYQQYPGQIWDYRPTVERQAAAFSSYVCQKVLHLPVVDSGNAGEDGKPRVLGLMTTTDPAYPNIIEYGQLIKQQVEACGGRFAATASFPLDASEMPGSYAATNMAQFKAKGVTTVIWGGGVELFQGEAAASLDYYPEWILAGDGGDDSDIYSQLEDASEWAHAWVVSYTTYYGPTSQQPCYVALQSVDPNVGSDAIYACLTDYEYEDLRQLFTGIQVAGPDLGVVSMDEGYHAIPPLANSNPAVPACFYPAGDYTCIQDSVVEHFNPDRSPPDAGALPQPLPTGCWQMLTNGARTLDGQPWPAGNINAQYQANDICNGYEDGV